MSERLCRGVWRNVPGAAAVLMFIAASAAGGIAGAGASVRAPPLIELVGTRLRARLADGSVREGAALVGGVLTLSAGDRILRVRLVGIDGASHDSDRQIWLYDFRVVATSGAEQPLCEPDSDGRRFALPIAGRSDGAGILTAPESGAIELVCTSSPQGKCVRLGYAPWRRGSDGRPMLDWYNACVRMMRGDYCGDGQPFTRNGTRIEIYDHVGVRRPGRNRSFRFEAAWDSRGAVCVAHTRIPELIELDDLVRRCPRLAGRLGPGCDDHFSGGLIFNRSQRGG